MKFSLSWLRTHLETDATLDQLTTTLSAIGLEVEAVEDRATPLAPFRTARIIEAVQHPNADRLRVCRVDIGGSEVSVVCGAPNARTGLHVVFAPPGAVIPASGITLKVGEIRGVVSAGMLLSAREMALGEDHDGIVELSEDAPVGVPYASWAGLDDPVIEIGVTPNRGDALAIRGVARDLAAAGLGRLTPWQPVGVPPAFDTPIGWEIAWPQACPWILGRSIRGLHNGPSPDWLQRRLLSIGLRPINALVDITNFFTFDLGRPLHVFDADTLAGHTLSLRPGAGEVFAALNGRTLTPGAGDLVIADGDQVVSLAGIMGGSTTGASEATNHVFLECALFDPVQVALSGRRHGIASDARARFERGLDQALPPQAVEAATRMILDLCGGEAGTVVSAGAEPAWRRDAKLRFERLCGLGGSDMLPEEAAHILQRLGFTPKVRDESSIVVAVPPWRNDIAGSGESDQSATLDPARAATARQGAMAIEPECDLLEEVLRIGGLDLIAPVSLPQQHTVPVGSITRRQSRSLLARRVLAARGLAECVTYSFMDRADAAAFGDTPAALTLNNPIAADLNQMRPTPLATLAEAARRNDARGAQGILLFEVGPGFAAGSQSLIAAGVRVGAAPRHWQSMPETADAWAAKGDVLALLSALGVPAESMTTGQGAPSWYHPGRSGVVRQGPKILLAQFGELHPTVLERLGLPRHAAGFELFLDAVPDPKRKRRNAPELSQYQPVRRDFAFIVPRDAPAETILRAARLADRSLIDRVTLFDLYEVDIQRTSERSLGIEVVFQPREHTMTEREIEDACAKVVNAVVKTTGAHLR
jgi:phenylalanyl-tRNA synthetase beta chain